MKLIASVEKILVSGQTSINVIAFNLRERE